MSEALQCSVVLLVVAGARVVLLNCLEVFGVRVLEQARDLGMTRPGWAWIVTDGMTGSVSHGPALYPQPTVDKYVPYCLSHSAVKVPSVPVLIRYIH